MTQITSKYAYGRQIGNKTAKEIELLTNSFFSKLIVPSHWQYSSYQDIYNTSDKAHLSSGHIFKTTKDTGTIYIKIVFIIAPERGAICEKTFDDIGSRPKYKTVISNKTIEEINEYIRLNY
ncbi:MAG: hypothetical protein VB066_01840 [Paludibacter sp.]|nr:hypothetical protein [Paludibacter sp.]